MCRHYRKFWQSSSASSSPATTTTTTFFSISNCNQLKNNWDFYLRTNSPFKRTHTHTHNSSQVDHFNHLKPIIVLCFSFTFWLHFFVLSQQSTRKGQNQKKRWPISKQYSPMSAIWWRWKSPNQRQLQEHRKKSFCQIQGMFPFFLFSFHCSCLSMCKKNLIKSNIFGQIFFKLFFKRFI